MKGLPVSAARLTREEDRHAEPIERRGPVAALGHRQRDRQRESRRRATARLCEGTPHRSPSSGAAFPQEDGTQVAVSPLM